MIIYKEGNSCYVDDAEDLIDFTINEPALAFCRDCYCYDYNKQYLSRERAEEKFNEWRIRNNNEKLVNAECDRKLMAKVKESYKEDFATGEVGIIDRGENWSPRYEIFYNKDAFDDIKDYEEGCYDGNEDVKHYIEELKAESRSRDVYWWPQFSATVYFANKDRWERIKNSLMNLNNEGEKKNGNK